MSLNLNVSCENVLWSLGHVIQDVAVQHLETLDARANREVTTQ